MNPLSNFCRLLSALAFLLAALSSHAATPQLALGAQHSLVLKADGTVWAFGENASGRLGDGTETGRAYPVRVAGLDNAVQVAAGYYHSAALKADGTVYCWGENLSGQLGLGVNGVDYWDKFDGSFIPYYETRQIAATDKHLFQIIPIVEGLDLSPIKGTEAYVGYASCKNGLLRKTVTDSQGNSQEIAGVALNGECWNDMLKDDSLEKRQFGRVFTVQ